MTIGEATLSFTSVFPKNVENVGILVVGYKNELGELS